MSAFFTPLSYCYVLFCCEIQSRYPGFTHRLPVCSPTALRMASGNPRKTYSHCRPRKMAKKKVRGTDRMAWMIDIGRELEMLAESGMWNRDTVHNQICLPFTSLPFVFSTPPVCLEIERVLNLIFLTSIPSEPNAIKQQLLQPHSTKSPLLNVSPSDSFTFREIIRTLSEIRNESAISVGQCTLCLSLSREMRRVGIRGNSREKIPAQGAFAIGLQNGAFRSPSLQQAS